MKLGIAEIMGKADRAETDEERIGILRQHASREMWAVIRYALMPGVKWGLPPGAPPYKPTQFIDQEGRLFSEVRRLYTFVDSGDEWFMNLSAEQLATRASMKRPRMARRRETLFVELLESIDPQDAKLLVCVKEGRLPFPNLTRSLLQQAFPGLLPDDGGALDHAAQAAEAEVQEKAKLKKEKNPAHHANKQARAGGKFVKKVADAVTGGAQ